ncbi:MAG TPA: hypothetical protein VLA36_16425 [Longimicrobiales bacterium]|nr:hypothetical protein [Longimicrobiales bacterium]
MDMERRNRIAQWAYDARSILGRFHVWLEDVDAHTVEGTPDDASFVGDALERAFVTAGAVTALGTRLFGRFGEGKGLDKAEMNRVKKDADAASAYVLSEALWSLTRNLPENHAVMVSLGEGLMPKAGETPEMGANPQLGFGRVYARPQVAHFLDDCVRRLLNVNGYAWPEFWRELQRADVTVWGAAVDTLENTSRFAKGSPTGPMTVLHVFNQPLRVAKPYEGYMAALVLPRRVADEAAERSVLVNYLTPRSTVMEAIRASFPDVKSAHVHVWTLGGPSRAARIGALWEEWRELGAHVVEDGWVLPASGQPVFTESGTYAPCFRVGPFCAADGERHLFICDGYAASAEAMQAASLDPVLGTKTSLCLFSSHFEGSYRREPGIMGLDPEKEDFPQLLEGVLGNGTDADTVEEYRRSIREARDAAIPMSRRTLVADDFFPNKEWQVLSIASCMLPDPYTGMPGVEEVRPGVYRVTTRVATRRRIVDVTLTLRAMETMDEMRMAFSPLLDRYYGGQDYRTRPVRVSDSGRIRNELQTLCAEAIEYLPDEQMRLHLGKLDDEVLPADKKALIREVVAWYKEQHPVWFGWLEVV